MSDSAAAQITEGGEAVIKGALDRVDLAAITVTGGMMIGSIVGALAFVLSSSKGLMMLVTCSFIAASIILTFWLLEQGPKSEILRMLDQRVHATDNGVPHLVLTDHDPETGRPRLRLMEVMDQRRVAERVVMTPIKTVVFTNLATDEDIVRISTEIYEEAEERELQSHVERTLAREPELHRARIEDKDVEDLALVRASLPGGGAER